MQDPTTQGLDSVCSTFFEAKLDVDSTWNLRPILRQKNDFIPSTIQLKRKKKALTSLWTRILRQTAEAWISPPLHNTII